MSLICALPLEMRLKILEFCTRKDLLSMTLCNSVLCADIRPILWKNVKVNERDLQLHSTSVANMFTLLLNTTSINFMGKGYDSPFVSDEEEEQQDTYWDNSTINDPILFTDEERNGSVSFGFALILNHCKERLKSLEFTGFMVRDGLGFAANTLNNLELLHLACVRLSHAHWDTLSYFRTLKKVIIMDCDVIDDHVKRLCTSNHLLEELELEVCEELTGICLENIPLLSHLRQLNVRSMYDFPAYLLGMPKQNNLLRMDMGYTEVDDEFFSTISTSVPQLKFLKIPQTNITDVGLSFISKLQMLESLDISDCQVTDVGAKYVPNLVSLKHLNMNRCRKVTNAGVFHIAKLRKLNKLDMGGFSQITDIAVSYISNVSSLRVLELQGCALLTDTSLQHISKLKHLHKLNIALNRQLTKVGMEHISGMKHLKWVVCFYCGFSSDQMTMDALRSAKGPGFSSNWADIIRLSPLSEK